MNNPNKWVPQPQMPMPPIGFGIVRPQPLGASSTISATHVPVNLSENSFTGWQCHPCATPINQIPQQQQQQWIMTQQKALEEQKVLYEKVLKQKQFDDQKQRLKEFSSRMKKSNVSADDMIQNIFEKQEQSAKTKYTKTYKGAVHSVTENIPKTGYYCSPSTLSEQTPKSSSLIFPQNHLPLNDNEKNKEPWDSQFIKHAYPVNNIPGNQNSSFIGNTTNINLSSVNTVPETLGSSCTLLNNHRKNVNPLIRNSDALTVQAPEKIPLTLPHWLKDSSKWPELYSRAVGLVQSIDGEWVDTSRAYMLLMQTNVPPHYLGILWEMVNQHKPGQLKTSEFCALLALVACVQNGKPFTNADILNTLSETICPVINHPMLLSLSKENQQPPAQELTCTSSTSSNPLQSIPQGIPLSLETAEVNKNDKEMNPSKAIPEGDDFDDFISAPVCSENENCSIQNFSPFPSVPPSDKESNHLPDNYNKEFPKLSQEAVKSNPVKNLPTLGNSPINHSKSTEASHDFDEFQSAPPSVSNSSPHLKSAETNGPNSKGPGKCVTLHDSISFDLQPFDTNKFSAENSSENFGFVHKSYEDKKYDTQSLYLDDLSGTDNFRAFTGKSFPQSLTDGSSESSNYITANASAETSNDDDDFGDFVGPSVGPTAIYDTNSYTKSVLQTMDIKSETQSVASLELPGLELTVNMGQNGVSNAASKPDLITSNSWMSEAELDHQFQMLHLNEFRQNKETLTKDECMNANFENQEDKYNYLRTFEAKIATNPHIDLWEKCLRGCKSLLEEGEAFACSLQEDSSVLKLVLATSQMKDYLTNLEEVWKVSQRIGAANDSYGPTSVISDFSFTTDQIWHSICRSLGKPVENVKYKINSQGSSNEKSGEEEDNEEGKSKCGLCLITEASLSYGGKNYHPQCANLWVNVVDSSLPPVSNTKVTSLLTSKPTLL